MSTNLKTAEATTPDGLSVLVTSFSGGTEGQKVQLSQGNPTDSDRVVLDRKQAADLIATLAEWLA